MFFRKSDEVFVEIERRNVGGRIRRIADHDGGRLSNECTIARSSEWKKFGVGSDGTERIAPPAIRKPNACIG